MERRHWLSRKRVLLTCTAFLVVPACSAPPKAADDRAQQLAAFQEKRDAGIQRLKAMDAPTLISAVQSDATKGVEPFNSMAYAELTSRGTAAAPALLQSLKTPDRSSLLGLLALRKLDAAGYKSLSPKFRVAVLVDALKTAKYFNTWGVLTAYWEDAAKALIAEGSPALPALAPLLRETRLAPVWGSEGAAITGMYEFRLSDYAWALVNAIRGKTVEIPRSAAARDKLIDVTIRDLSTR